MKNPSLPSLPVPLRSGVMAPARVPSIAQIVLDHLSYLKPFNCVQKNELGLVLKCYLQSTRLQIIYIYIYIYIYRYKHLPNLSVRPGCDTESVFKRSLTGLISEYFFSKTGCPAKVKEPSLHHCLPTDERRIGFMPFTKVLAPYEM